MLNIKQKINYSKILGVNKHKNNVNLNDLVKCYVTYFFTSPTSILFVSDVPVRKLQVRIFCLYFLLRKCNEPSQL